MLESSSLSGAAEVMYLYDGSLAGFYNCVYESVYLKQIPFAILPENQAAPSLFAQKLIRTDRTKALKVEKSIPHKISERALELVENVFLSCLPDKEVCLLRFLLLGYRNGAQTVQMMGHPTVAPLLAAEGHLCKESQLLRGFIRFSDYDGFLAAVITPKNFVLPFLAHHFTGRFAQENFLIYDRTHGAALVHQNGKAELLSLDGLNFPQVSENEEKYRSLWKQFYQTITIEARINPKCRMTHMPKRYWENMTEMQDFL